MPGFEIADIGNERTQRVELVQCPLGMREEQATGCRRLHAVWRPDEELNAEFVLQATLSAVTALRTDPCRATSTMYFRTEACIRVLELRSDSEASVAQKVLTISARTIQSCDA